MALIKANDTVLAVTVMVKMLNNFLDFLNVGKSMSDSQVLETAKLMLEDYAVLKPDDFVLFFNKAKKGHYGKAYDRMDGAVIFEWLEVYMYERDSEIESIRSNENKRHEKTLNQISVAVPMPEYFKPFMEKKVVETNSVKRQPTEQELIVKAFISDFDMEAKVYGAKKYLTRIGRKMDINEFLNYRIQGIS